MKALTEIDKRIGGFIETSFLDWEGKISAVVFLRLCNFRCPFCHAGQLLKSYEELANFREAGPQYSWERIIHYVNNYRGWLDGVVITGGEPTVYPDLPEILEYIHSATHMPIKLDTNGYFPEVLQRCLPYLAAVAMDIKAPPDKYDLLTASQVDMGRIKASLEILETARLQKELEELEYRTTVVPQLLVISKNETEDDLCKIAWELIPDARYWVLQQCVTTRALSETVRQLSPYPAEVLKAAAQRLEKYVQRCWVRGV